MSWFWDFGAVQVFTTTISVSTGVFLKSADIEIHSKSCFFSRCACLRRQTLNTLLSWLQVLFHGHHNFAETEEINISHRSQGFPSKPHFSRYTFPSQQPRVVGFQFGFHLRNADLRTTLCVQRQHKILRDQDQWLDKTCGGFLSHRGTPSYHPFLDGIFHEINHPAMGVLPFFRKPPYYIT